MYQPPNIDEISIARNRLAALRLDQLINLPTEELLALSVTLQQVLDKIHEARTAQEAGQTQRWEELTT